MHMPERFPDMCMWEKSLGTVITKKPVIPSEEEQRINKRSQSAKLRVFERRRES